jgi:murein DD-endopeptidase MepM/ murein hydrolase activator NlpD
MRIAKNAWKTGVMGWMMLCAAAGALAAEAPSCTEGMQLSLSAPQLSQGNLLLAQARSPRAMEKITGTWMERDIYFWKAEASGVRRSAEVQEALLGADLEKAPGNYKLMVTATFEDGSHADCTAELSVREGKFATESLTVANQFVEPDKQQVERAATEQQKLRQLFDRVTPEKLWRGNFQFPLAGITHGTNFGKRRILNGQARPPHTGADFPAVTGTSVHATQSGRVALAEELFFSGNTVIVDHGLGVYSLYGHLSAIGVESGQTVQAGEVIGKVGATGRVTGPHLHWGVTVNKARVNPVQLVSLSRSPQRRPTKSKK